MACEACTEAGAGHSCQHSRDARLVPIGRNMEAFVNTWAATLGAGQDFVSPIETRLLEAFLRAGLEPEQQYEIGPYVADFAFPYARLVVEADGKEFHDEVRDARRDQYMLHRGWYVRRFSGAQIMRDPDECVRLVYKLARASAA